VAALSMAEKGRSIKRAIGRSQAGMILMRRVDGRLADRWELNITPSLAIGNTAAGNYGEDSQVVLHRYDDRGRLSSQ
jgi:hypothetical protein